MNTELKARHPFSYTLGPGPYEFVGEGSITNGRYCGPKIDEGAGTCAHCGTAIMSIYIIRTGEGKLMGVGSDCINKVGNSGDFSNITDFERALRKKKKAQRDARKKINEEKLRTELEKTVQDNTQKLVTIPHPSSHFSGTALDYCYWYLSTSRGLGGYKIFKAKLQKWLTP